MYVKVTLKMKRFVFSTLLCVTSSGCEMLTGPANSAPNVDGSYLGDYESRIGYYAIVNGGLQLKTTSISGAVGFTIKGTKIITTPLAGDGVAEWDPVNKYWWLDFDSIYSASASYCHQYHYAGTLRASDGYIKAEGTMSCTAPGEDYSSSTSTWMAKRQ